MQDFKQPRKLNKKNYLNNINNSNKPFIIYKTIKGFDLFTDFSKKIILNNQNISKFLNQKYKTKIKYKSTDLLIGFFGYELLNNLNDTEDAFPFDALEWSDNDMDGIGDNSDTDDDGDNWTDVVESDCGTDPMNATSIPGDFEGDGVCDPLDEDDDNDGANDSTDVWPYDRCASSDYDSDDLADELLIDCETVIGIDDDDDGDGVHDTDDGCPRGHIGWTSNPVNDIDGDGCHEIEDYDNDGDGFNNIDDSFPDDPAEWNDADQDGVGDNRDAFPSDSNETIDADGDGVGDNTDAYPNDSSRWNIVDNPVTEGIGDYIIVALAGIFLILLIALLIPLKKK